MGRPLVAAFLAVLSIAACAGGSTAITSSPTPKQPSPSPIASPVITDQPSATPIPSPTPIAAVLHCRLPISNGQPGSGGFLVFPGGKFVADAGSNVIITGVPTPAPGGPYGYSNFYGLSYDRRHSKWLPVARQMVTPDETRYVFGAPDSVFVVNVADGARTELGKGTGHGWNVLAVTSDGVYANPVQSSTQPVAGIWVLPFSGAPRQVTTKGYWQAVGGSGAFGYEAPSIPAGASQRLVRLDLKSGTITPWFNDLPQYTNVLGFDLKGHPIVFLQGTPQQLLVLTGSNESVALSDGSFQNFYVSGVLADPHGLWLTAGDGIYLWKGVGTNLERASQVTGPIAGPCT